jgi:hypothetical protein
VLDTPEVRRTVVAFRAPPCVVGFRAEAFRARVFFAAPFPDEVLRLPWLEPCRVVRLEAVRDDFPVDLPAFRAPPRAVLRADDLDRLLDDALRLAMSVILVYLP